MTHVYLLNPRTEVVTAFLDQGAHVTKIVESSNIGVKGSEMNLTGVQFLAVKDIMDPLEVADAIIGMEPDSFVGERICVGLGDQTSLVASVVNNLLGVAPDKYVDGFKLQILRNKPLLRSKLSESMPQNSGYFKVVDHVEEVRQAFLQCPNGIIVKPINASGSRGVFHIRSLDEVESNHHKFSFPVLVEQFFTGPEYSIEAITVDGVHQILAVTEKILGGESGVVEVGQIQPARISESTKQLLFETTSKLLDVVGLNFGLSHTEAILEEGVPKIVESHGRVGGDRIADLLRFTTGHDAFERLAVAVHSGVFLPIQPSAAGSRIDFVDLSDYSGSDEEWRNQVLANPRVQLAEILKPPNLRGPIRCSADRHAFVVTTV